MKIVALPGVWPEGLDHLLIGWLFRIAQQPFRQRKTKGRR